MNLKEEAREIMKKKGNARGEVFKSYAAFFESKYGKSFLDKLQKKLEELDCPLRFDQVKALSWVPEAYSQLIMSVLQEEFNWKEEDFFILGQEAPKYSFIMKILMRHFSSPERVLKEASNSWYKYFDFADISVADYNEKEKYVYLRLKDYDMGPLMCIYLSGYILSIARLTIKSQEIKIEETKCLYKNDNYHEYKITWN
jgi:hypothetical protein